MAKTSKFDVADYLKTPERVDAYLTEVLETGDTALICAALDTIKRVRAASDTAKAMDLTAKVARR